MAELTYRDAVARGIAQEMTRDPDVIFFGEDVAKAGGVFKTTVGLYEQFGACAASGQADAEPTSVMNSRRVMCSPQAGDHTLPHRKKVVLCITAFWPNRLPLWVKTRIRLFDAYVSFCQLRTYRPVGHPGPQPVQVYRVQSW
jgi:hypothetical protein